MNTIATDLADYVIATLRAQEAELRQAGVRRLSLFGSVARGDAAEDSDIDLAAEFDPAAEMDLIRLVALERQLGEALGRHVEILPEPVENPHLRANVSGIAVLPSKHNPADSLRHIMENAERIAQYLARLDQRSFAPNDWARDAVERCVERVCEATVRLGEQADELMPGQPWSDIRGMGNRLRHAYDRVDVDILWRTATNRVPELAAAARRALAKLEGRQG